MGLLVFQILEILEAVGVLDKKHKQHLLQLL